MHCLWVYFLGEFIRKSDNYKEVFINEFKQIQILLKDYDEFNFNYTDVQQGFIENFIKFMCYGIKISFEIDTEVGSEIEKILEKTFIQKDGKLLIDDNELDKLGEIEYKKLQEYINKGSSIEMKVDFTICKTDLSFVAGWFQIDFIFENENIEALDPEFAFKGRCKRFLTLFDIHNLDDNLKIRLRCIYKLFGNNNIYCLEIARKYANIIINGEEQNIPNYLGSRTFYTKAEYQIL